MDILFNATADDWKIGIYVIASFMSMQIAASVARYHFNVVLNPFDHIAKLFQPKKCVECNKEVEMCCCFQHLQNYKSEFSDD